MHFIVKCIQFAMDNAVNFIKIPMAYCSFHGFETVANMVNRVNHQLILASSQIKFGQGVLKVSTKYESGLIKPCEQLADHEVKYMHGRFIAS